MPAASACAVSSPAAASGTCRPPPTTCASYTGSLSAAPDQPQRGTPTATGPSSEPPEARQGRLPAMLNRFKRQRPAIQQQALQRLAMRWSPDFGQVDKLGSPARRTDPDDGQADAVFGGVQGEGGAGGAARRADRGAAGGEARHPPD